MKHRLAAGCICLFLLCALTLQVSALTPTYTIQGAYATSVYYERLKNLPKTGDPAFDTVAVALTQLGYHEGNSTADFHGKNASGTGNYTEYNRAFGKIGGSYGYAWCAAFASWCLSQAGVSELGSYASCTLWVEHLRDISRYHTRAGGYTPTEGDLIFFRSAGVSRASDHVGIVRGVKAGRVYTIEGNSSNRVTLHDYALSDTYIVGYGHAEGTRKLPKTAFEIEDTATGYYTITNSTLNVRAKRSSSATLRGSLSLGDIVLVEEVQDGWGKINYQGKTSYISLAYADFLTPCSYKITYTADSATGVPPALSYLSCTTETVSGMTPLRDGYEFRYWESEDGTRLYAGDPLPHGDITLCAVFEELPPKTVLEDPPLPIIVEGQTAPLDENTEPSPVPMITAEELPLSSDSGTSAKSTALASTLAGILTTVLALYWEMRGMRRDA